MAAPAKAGYESAPAPGAPSQLNLLTVAPETVHELLREESQGDAQYLETLCRAWEVVRQATFPVLLAILPETLLSEFGVSSEDTTSLALDELQSMDKLLAAVGRIPGDEVAADITAGNTVNHFLLTFSRSLARIKSLGQFRPTKYMLASSDCCCDEALGIMEKIASTSADRGMVMLNTVRAAPETAGVKFFSSRWLHDDLAYAVGHTAPPQDSQTVVGSAAPSIPSASNLGADQMDGPTFLRCIEPHRESQIKIFAMCKMGKEGIQRDPGLLRQAVFLLRDQDWEVKRHGVFFLRQMRDVMTAEALEFLNTLVAHPSPDIRVVAAAVLQEIPQADDRWEEVLGNRDAALETCRNVGLGLEFLGQFCEDREVVKAAIKENGNALQFAHESLLSDVELVLKAVSLKGCAVRFADPQLVTSHPGLSALRDGSGIGICGEYLILEEIGKGVYGSVTRAQRFGSEEMVAIKKLHDDPDAWADGIPAHALREVSLLIDFQHPNIVHLKELVEVDRQDIRLVFEYLPMDLHVVLRNQRRNGELLPIEKVRRYTRDLLAGTYACHCRSMVHRDLKPQNILVDHDGTMKLADFGLSRMIVSPLRSHTLDVVTLWYRAPEILLGAQRYGFEVDIWSAGCILAEMCIGHALFAGDSEIGTIFKIFQVLGTPSETNWPEGMALDNFKGRFPKWTGVGVQSLMQTQPALAENEGLDLLSKLLCFDPQTRVTSRRASQHQFCQL
eukprot:TRINITY_DN1662_c0_g2_i2.p1 TRINITY_DN1662_c0_g2~~TRINITY_DN1662_c0_g2_i2.p1  ORF type:complete len:755 (-),score=101.95 TRINITY_DN1662_c0_g2_i2:186-2375(-)